jgi:hypothetical protein
MKRRTKLRAFVGLGAIVAAMSLSAGVANATRANGSFSFGWNVPAFGSQTYHRDADRMWTTNNYNDINVKYSAIPNDTWTKAVYCSDLSDVDGNGRFITAGDHSLRVIADGSQFRDGVCYFANLNGPSTSTYNVAGSFKS